MKSEREETRMYDEKIGRVPELAIVGIGIIGLTTAYKLALASSHPKGEHINIKMYTYQPIEETTSYYAGASFKPHMAVYNEFAEQSMIDTWIWYEQLMEHHKNEDHGLHFGTHVEAAQERGAVKEYLKVISQLNKTKDDPSGVSEVDNPPEVPGFKHGVKYNTFHIDPETHLIWLAEQVRSLGVEILYIDEPYETLEEMSKLNADVIFNCTGLGSRRWDDNMISVGGQIVRTKPIRGLKYTWSAKTDKGGRYGYTWRKNNAVFGGSAMEGVFLTEPNADLTEDIIAQNKKILPTSENNIQAVDVIVANRPMRREGIRTAVERTHNGKPIVHNYGHGGSGYTFLASVNTAIAMAADLPELQSVSKVKYQNSH